MSVFTVYHHSFEVLGGSERVAVAVIRVLKDLGMKVRLVTLVPPDDKIYAWDRNYVKPDEVIRVNFPLKFGLYKALYLSLRTVRGNTISTIGDITNCDYNYIHFPWSISEVAGIKVYKGTKRIYFLPYKVFHRKIKNGGKMLANSRWTGEILRKAGFQYQVVYPPVDVEKYSQVGGKERDPRTVLTISRISPEKDLDNLFYVAEKLKNFNFYLLGSSGRSRRYLQEVLRKAESLHNLKVITNFDDKTLLDIMGKAKLYFHPKIEEHFGISVVEAMSAGIIPVVHKSGGTWMDIVDEGKYGFGYSSKEEAVNSLIEASKSSLEVKKRAEMFTFKKFEATLLSILERAS
ncbi:hypothetical protein CM19_05200 [Candidatus Acidianus copahuensis]|uniref:Glycosyl transferase family 1 domain-containing protein n=1 Tax=Candidatus Acidianus copahuensis TaxID=1160895 RepID=A0A031LQ13_9CREN|nr:glycosyltransferase [Candidatus Acidianus copahuensis]EZQ07101.1 hypothetical protein CM19_05200 [Candidatus Acidianus copahuensis]